MASSLVALVVVLVISAATADVDASSKCSPGYETCSKDRNCKTNVWSDTFNCGECEAKCEGGPHTTSKCIKGKCSIECDEEHGWCDCDGKTRNGCVNIQTDTNNCGKCKHVCPAPPNFVASCEKGTCKKECKYGYKRCYNTCKKVGSDVDNCGRCGKVCPGGAIGTTAVCIGGKCDLACQSGFAKCNGTCADVATDVSNCGSCGTVCSGGPSKGQNGTIVCAAGHCDLACLPGYTKCAGRCVHLSTQTRYGICNGECVNLNMDLNNCGECGKVCVDQYPRRNLCNAASCLSICESETMMMCNGTTVNVKTDLFNCGTCGTVCTDEYPQCVCGSCSGDACFPGDATITLASGGAKRMSDLMLGDKVAVRGRGGSLAFEDVYAFGHRDALASASFVQVTVKPVNGDDVSDPAAAESRTLELTALHFVPVSAGSAGTLTYKRARDVILGDRMWADGSVEVEVTGISEVHKQGLYNPFTLGGTIIVNGVVASTHSEWFLDGVFEVLGVVEWLPWAYQALLLPVRMLYLVLGKDAYIVLYRWLDAAVDVAAFGSKHGGSIAIASAGLGMFAMAKLVSRRA